MYAGSACLLSFFFFQAEDGIRYLVRSRGLGDVYKRQLILLPVVLSRSFRNVDTATLGTAAAAATGAAFIPVSYTHLTLPTSDLV